MNCYKIIGKSNIEGTIKIGGNKNAALACICATLLTDSKVTLTNVPNIEDVKVMLHILEGIGKKITQVDEKTFTFESGNLVNNVPKNLGGLIRGSILLCGAFMARKTDLLLPIPGGDVIGARRLDSHFLALRQLGVLCSFEKDGYLSFSIKDKLKANEIFLEEASVTATENVILASSLAEGTTTIYNAACEPHVQDLCKMLNLMGCKISGIGSNLLTIEGQKKLNGCDFTLGFDFMEAGSYIGLAAATKGELQLDDVNTKQLRVISSGFEKLGITYTCLSDTSILVPKKQERIIKKSIDGRTIKLDDAPWPGFPTDLLSIMSVVATQMEGSVLIHEKMFESRLYFVDYLIRMGANIIQCDPHRIVISGKTNLVATPLISPDVRAGMALLIAALCAEGESTITNPYQIERGYENLQSNLLSIGANIQVFH